MKIRLVEGVLWAWLGVSTVLADENTDESAAPPSMAFLEFLGEWGEEGEQWLEQSGFDSATDEADVGVRNNEHD